MIQNRREYLRRRRIVYICCIAFFIIVAILIGILIGRVRDNSDAASTSNEILDASEIDSTAQVSPEADGTAFAPSGEIASAGSGNWMEVMHSEVRETAIENSIPVIAPPSGYELRFMTQADIHKGNLLLINKNYAYEFLDFASDDELDSMFNIMSGTYDVSGTDVMMQSIAAGPMDSMLTDFYNNTWMDDLIILCGYRTKEESQELFDDSAEKNGLEHAERYVMKPGYSEHHSALSADIGILNYDGTITYQFYEEPYSWLTSNCHKYGFVVRYPEDKADITEIDFESWHFRYVGVPHATAMTNEGLCMEEYIDFIKNYTAGNLHYQVTTADGIYEIYYAEGIQVPVPTGYEYEISGNNVDGFIITMKIG